MLSTRSDFLSIFFLLPLEVLGGVGVVSKNPFFPSDSRFSRGTPKMWSSFFFETPEPKRSTILRDPICPSCNPGRINRSTTHFRHKHHGVARKPRMSGNDQA